MGAEGIKMSPLPQQEGNQIMSHTDCWSRSKVLYMAGNVSDALQKHALQPVWQRKHTTVHIECKYINVL